MDRLLLLREKSINFYKLNEYIVNFFLKFIIGILTFSLIGSIRMVDSNLVFLTTQPILLIFVIFMSLIFAFIPIYISYIFIIINITLQLSLVIEVAGIVFLLLTSIWLLYIRLAPKESWFILATVLAFYCKLEYVIPLIAGLYFSVASIIPISIGVFIWKIIQGINNLILTVEAEDVSSFDIITLVYPLIYSQTEWIFFSFIFAIQVIVIIVISKQAMAHAKQIAIIFASVLSVFGFIILFLVTDLNINLVRLVLLSFLALCICIIISFTDVLLDYKNVEKVEFEDDNNYYFVKVVPKIYLNKAKESED